MNLVDWILRMEGYSRIWITLCYVLARKKETQDADSDRIGLMFDPVFESTNEIRWRDGCP